jgi:hypothetical protein
LLKSSFSSFSCFFVFSCIFICVPLGFIGLFLSVLFKHDNHTCHHSSHPSKWGFISFSLHQML